MPLSQHHVVVGPLSFPTCPPLILTPAKANVYTMDHLLRCAVAQYWLLSGHVPFIFT